MRSEVIKYTYKYIRQFSTTISTSTFTFIAVDTLHPLYRGLAPLTLPRFLGPTFSLTIDWCLCGSEALVQGSWGMYPQSAIFGARLATWRRLCNAAASLHRRAQRSCPQHISSVTAVAAAAALPCRALHRALPHRALVPPRRVSRLAGRGDLAAPVHSEGSTLQH